MHIKQKMGIGALIHSMSSPALCIWKMNQEKASMWIGQSSNCEERGFVMEQKQKTVEELMAENKYLWNRLTREERRTRRLRKRIRELEQQIQRKQGEPEKTWCGLE